MQKCMSKLKISPFVCSQLVFRSNLTHWAKEMGAKYLLQRTLCVGLFARQKCAIFENHGSTVFGRYLSIRSCSAWPPGVFCQVLWSGMLGVGCGEQWQLGSKQNTSGFAGRPWAQPVSLDRRGQRNIKNSTNQSMREEVDKYLLSWSLLYY
jgi:hypothetical protein